MKTSNKILLVFCITVFGFLFATRAVLYSKYVNNKYTPEDVFNQYYYAQYNLPAIKHVSIKSIALCRLLTAATPKLMIEKNGSHYASYEVHGDTLVISGYVSGGADGNGKLNRSPQDVRLYLPQNVDVTALSSTINIQGDTLAAKPIAYNITLNYSTLNTRLYMFRDTVDRYFDTLNVKADNRSDIYFDKHDFFKGVNAILNRSVINDGSAVINNIKVAAGSTSTLVIAGKNIDKLNYAGNNR